MFKVNNKDTRATSLWSFECLYCWLKTYFTHFCVATIVDFGHAFVCWALGLVVAARPKLSQKHFYEQRCVKNTAWLNTAHCLKKLLLQSHVKKMNPTLFNTLKPVTKDLHKLPYTVPWNNFLNSPKTCYSKDNPVNTQNRAIRFAKRPSRRVFWPQFFYSLGEGFFLFIHDVSSVELMEYFIKLL